LATTSNRQVLSVCFFKWMFLAYATCDCSWRYYSNCFEIGKSNLYSLLSQIRGRQLWGADIYTDDSDIVAGKKRWRKKLRLLGFIFLFPNVYNGEVCVRVYYSCSRGSS
jgi:hypothetical protein